MKIKNLFPFDPNYISLENAREILKSKMTIKIRSKRRNLSLSFLCVYKIYRFFSAILSMYFNRQFNERLS